MFWQSKNLVGNMKKDLSFKIHKSKDPIDATIRKIIPICYDINVFAGCSSNSYRYRSLRKILKNLSKHK